MKAAIIKKYGSANNISIQDNIEKPIPRDHEVLIQIQATALNPFDIETRRGDFKIFTPPQKKRKSNFDGTRFFGRNR